VLEEARVVGIGFLRGADRGVDARLLLRECAEQEGPLLGEECDGAARLLETNLHPHLRGGAEVRPGEGHDGGSFSMRVSAARARS